MDGIIIDSTVTDPIIGETLIGQDIREILTPSGANKYCNTLSRAYLEDKRQWCDYTIIGRVFVVLVEWEKDTETFVVHETSYDGSIHDIQLRLSLALKNYRENKR